MVVSRLINHDIALNNGTNLDRKRTLFFFLEKGEIKKDKVGFCRFGRRI